MKNIIFSIVVLFAICQPLSAQSVMPTYTDQPSWTVAETSYGWVSCVLNIIKPDAPLSICSNTYFPVLRCDFGGNNCKTIGFYRVAGTKVYVRGHPQWGGGLDCAYPEQLMYDFSLAVGDTVFCAYTATDSSKFWNVSQSALPYQGVTRLTLIMQSSYTQMKWIQGIGSNIHPFFPLICLGPQCHNADKLVSASINGSLTYFDNSYDPYFPCAQYVSIKNNSAYESIKIYPKLTTGIISIDNLADKMHYQIINITGEVIQSGSLNEGNNSIDLENFARGIYFLKLKDSGQGFVQKIIKE